MANKFKLTDVIVKLNAALERIGRANGHQAPVSQDPADSLLHEYHVSSVGALYFDKRKKAAKAAMEEAIPDVGKDKMQDLAKLVAVDKTARRVHLIEGKAYTLSAQVKSSGTMLDEKQLRNALMKRMTVEDMESILKECTKQKQLSTVYEVLPREEEK